METKVTQLFHKKLFRIDPCGITVFTTELATLLDFIYLFRSGV